ncbi:site-specific integrase [Streptomyces lunaelactis]|uniref:site-specific integrase n=1 Tax=Streptomyces lunaelactis TaxID=1535768 RepID=UPI00158547C1|nr:site-specific integrase [Streptomyces lunaelactis]NUK36414.1 site-specific integrase [Streptomyces lunaelactis]NUK45781.1 site-specific integrase [Streptomyces lunaelactis]NUK93416.1 site-specific integrase [Streptomyces lunaelactis]NUL30910.1 site-specific integrase [Streptomyces lunaelactis]
MSGKRGNGEGSIYPYKNGYAAYVWVTKPDGKRARKYAYGKSREEVHEKWLQLHAEAKKGPVATRHRTLAAFLTYWLDSIVKPNLAPLSYVSYEGYVRLYIGPYLGAKRLDKLTVRDVREWLTKLATVCQCCAQGKDAKRATARRKCCAVGDCCESYPSRRVIQGSRDALRAALTHAVSEEEIGKNVAALVKVPKPRRQRIKPWSVAEAGQFLTDAAARDDHLFAAWVLVLCLGLRRGEVLGLTWKSVDFETSELYVDHQIQRAGRQILHRETKTEDSDDFLPLPALCLKALRMRRAQQLGDRKAAGELWQDSHGLVFTTKYGTPIEPGNLTRMFALRARRAGLRVIPLRNTRHTCSSLLVALKVHPKVAQRILRHSQIAMTMEVYAEASEEAVRDAIGKLSDAMGGTG